MDEIKEAKNWLSALEVNSEFEASSKEYILSYIEQLEKENKLLYLKGLHDGKEQATADLTITKQKLAEDALCENVRLKKELDNKNKEIKFLKGCVKIYMEDK